VIVACDLDGIKLAATTIRKGGLVVFPTDTVYGLGCDPRNPRAVQSIFRIKKEENQNNSQYLDIRRMKSQK